MAQRLALILEAVSVPIILILCIAVYAHNGGGIDHAQLSLKGSGAGGIVVGMGLAIFAFVGFESAGAMGQEAREPAKSVPRAIMWSCGIVGVFYLIVVYAQVYGFGSKFGNATAPLPQLAGVVGLGWLGHVIAIGITCSMFACALACLTAGSRMLLALGPDCLLPKGVTPTTRHTQAPQGPRGSGLGCSGPDDGDPGRLHRGGLSRPRADRRRGTPGNVRLHARL